jgi:hypothetical protein
MAGMVVIVADLGIVVGFMAMFMTVNVIVGMPVDQITVPVFMAVTVTMLVLMGYG